MKKLLPLVILVLAVLAIGGVVLTYTRQHPEIRSFEACAAKYPVQQSFPQVCVTPTGKSFVDPAQAKCSTEPELTAECAKANQAIVN
jgi:hypothetical protein